MAVAVVLRGGQKPRYFNKSYPVPPLHPVGVGVGERAGPSLPGSRRVEGVARQRSGTTADQSRRPESSPRSGRCCGRYICRRPRPRAAFQSARSWQRRHCLGARGDVRRSPAPFPSPSSALQASHPSPPDPVSSRLTFDRCAGLLSRTGPCDDDTTNNVSWPRADGPLSVCGREKEDVHPRRSRTHELPSPMPRGS
jgi:hypothetical protein